MFDKLLDERAVYDRLSTLIKGFQAQNLRSKRKSGTEQEYDKAEQLMKDIFTLVKNATKPLLQKGQQNRTISRRNAESGNSCDRMMKQDESWLNPQAKILVIFSSFHR